MTLRYRKHVRLPDRDYTQGTFFVTLCAHRRIQAFGQIVGTGTDARMELTDAGRIVDDHWRAIPVRFPHVRLDEMQIMPDHLHAILVLERGRGHRNDRSTQWVDATGALSANGRKPNGPKRGSLGAIIAAFKSGTTKQVNRLHTITGRRLWQPNYYERVIREIGGERERIARYIAENPEKWR